MAAAAAAAAVEKNVVEGEGADRRAMMESLCWLLLLLLLGQLTARETARELRAAREETAARRGIRIERI